MARAEPRRKHDIACCRSANHAPTFRRPDIPSEVAAAEAQAVPTKLDILVSASDIHYVLVANAAGQRLDFTSIYPNP
jgi:3-oxoacyl-ACP reductase-like protein